MQNGLPRILIIRLSAIGDVVRVLPALNTIRAAYPNAQIDWAVEPKSAGVVEDHPLLDNVLVFDRDHGSRAFLQFCRQIRARRYDIAVDFHGILKSGAIIGASRAPERYGFASPRAQEGSWIFTNHRAALRSKNMNRVAENLALCDLFCKRREAYGPAIYVPPDIQEAVDAFYEESFDAGKRVVAMHAPMERPEKRWPAERFAELAERLLADGRFEVLMTWGPGQRGDVEAVVSLMRRKPVVPPETGGLKELAWLLHRADLYFGGDTGPMHIASIMGVPVVAVFGGTDPAKHAPYQRPCEILYVDDPSLSAEEKLRRITADKAFDACIRMVSGQARRPGDAAS
ncbi:MAG TPA: glycosyltransferase family 9 protein [Candidatus Hydrogenedentes bacterium]|nr:glycosyltransferase family 9 protein [Candidatus Hydrogenedentota bacterium]HOV75583.1 glycosyltransferase family 9 protein [Candidatus Hydrogenedentota bacterium]